MTRNLQRENRNKNKAETIKIKENDKNNKNGEDIETHREPINKEDVWRIRAREAQQGAFARKSSV